ncbi:MAG: HAMP domain-containing sensor histidine kinase [Rubrivivax sp.]
MSEHRRWHRRFRHSLQARLVAVFVLLALATSAVFFAGMQRLVQGGWQVYLRPLLEDYATRVAADLGSPPVPERARALAARLPVRVRIEGPQVNLDTLEGGRSLARWRRGAEGDNGTHWRMVRESADGQHRITFTLAEPPEAWRERGMSWVVFGALLVLTLLAWLMVRRLLAPLKPITRGVEAYGRGDFSRRIRAQAEAAVRRGSATRPPRDELDELAGRIDAMADSLHGMLEAKRALLLAISHELRSPLTRARLNAELVTEGPERSALLRDLAEMRELITSLLESERLAQGHAALQRERTDLAALVRETVATAVAAAAEPGGAAVAPLHADIDIDEGIGTVDVDPTRVRLVLRNLLANAWRHAGDTAKPPLVFLKREGDGQLALGVRDHGSGVAPEVLAQLGEAFHRPDSARTRSAGGVGLGLYLCRLVAVAHGGELRLRNAAPGLEAAMVWPANPAASATPTVQAVATAQPR